MCGFAGERTDRGAAYADWVERFVGMFAFALVERDSADEVFGGYPWYSPMAGADGLGTDDYARVFFDRARGLFRPEYVDALLAAPNEARTNLDGSELLQLGLLEPWLQEQGL